MKLLIELIILFILLGIIIAISWIYRNPSECTIDPVLERLRQDLIKVDPRAAKLQFFPSDESYTEDKTKVFICLKDEKGEYYPYNDLLAVVLHEGGHCFSAVIDKEHITPEFNGMHNALRKRATELGIFNPNNPVSPTYCPKK